MSIDTQIHIYTHTQIHREVGRQRDIQRQRDRERGKVPGDGMLGAVHADGAWRVGEGQGLQLVVAAEDSQQRLNVGDVQLQGVGHNQPLLRQHQQRGARGWVGGGEEAQG